MAQATQTPVSYLDPQTLAAISSLQLRARMVVEGLMIGMHRSPHQGFSAEFAQHRQYAPGDDLRHLDWKVFGRTDKLYLKQYQKETNLDLAILVDCSSSMGYSSQSKPAWRKYDMAASVAAAIAYLAIRQQDRVSLALFADTLTGMTRMSNSHDHWRSIVGGLAGVGSFDQQRQTDIGRMFDQVTAKLTQRSLIVIISDMFDDAEVLERGLAQLHHRRHDVMLFQTLDHAELDFPFRAASQFFGLEGEGRLDLDPTALRKGYLASFNEHRRRVESIARRFVFDYLMLDTSQSLGPPLSHFLAWRAAGAGRGR